MSETNAIGQKIVMTMSAEETAEQGACLARLLGGGETIALHGDLGAGKTVFAQGIARGLGINGPVTSPTFPIVQNYNGPAFNLNHIDLYRINSEEEAIAFGIEDFLASPDTIAVVEWADRIPTLLKDPLVTVTLNAINITQRQITVQM